MRKGILLSILVLVIVIGVLGMVKGLQIRAMVEQGKRMTPPPDNVTAAAVRTELWEASLSAVGSLSAVQGVMVAAEVTGKVVEIAFEPGQKVRKGELLIRQDASVEAAELPGAEAKEALARSVLARNTEMLEEKIISRADYDAAVAEQRQSAAGVDTLRAVIGKKAIRAPFGGRLGIRQVNLGQLLREGDPIVTLQSLDPIYVDFSLPQQEMPRLERHLPVRLTSDAAPGRAFSGRLTTISPLVDANTRNVPLQATMKNPGERLRPGMFVSVELLLPVREKVTVLPETAVLHAPYGDSVYVVVDDGKGGKVLRQQFVRLGERRGDFVAVTEGVKEGDTVVTTGVFKLRNGQAVTVDNRLAPEFRLDPRPVNG